MEGKHGELVLSIEVLSDGSVFMSENGKRKAVREVNIAFDARNNLVIRSVETVPTPLPVEGLQSTGMFQDRAIVSTTVLNPETLTKYGMPKPEVKHTDFIFDPDAQNELEKTLDAAATPPTE